MEAGQHQPASDWLASLQSLLLTVVIAVFVITFVVQAFQIPSESMESTLLIGDYLLVDKFRFGSGQKSHTVVPYRPVHRGDIIVFKYPVTPNLHFVKRVVGIPGDRVRLVNRQVYVNGVRLLEPYVQHTQPMHNVFRDEFPRLNSPVADLESSWWLQMQKLVEDGQLIVPEGHFFVLGDNRDNSKDSRYWGFVPQENIIGRPLIIYWSLQSTGEDMPISLSLGDKLLHFAYAATHVLQITRWDRTFRIVN
jgi:signal peptidase I